MKHYSFLVPSVWESVNRIRFGIDTSVLKLRFPDRSEAVLTQMIRTGISSHDLWVHATHLGVPDAQLRSLLGRLTPVLVPPQHTPGSFAVFDDFRTGQRIAQSLVRAGFTWNQGQTGHSGIGATALTVERFGYNPSRNALLCARGFRVLPIRFTDRAVTIGPILDEETLCTHCLHLTDVESDAPWLQWAEQLIGRPVPSEHRVSLGAVSAVVTELMSHAVDASAGHMQITIEHSLHGDIDRVRRGVFHQHPSCDRHESSVFVSFSSDNRAA